MYLPKLKLIPLRCDSTNFFVQLWFWIKSVRNWEFSEDFVIYCKETNAYYYMPTGLTIGQRLGA